jgi:hypothetical protein
MVIFHSYVNVYQRVSYSSMIFPANPTSRSSMARPHLLHLHRLRRVVKQRSGHVRGVPGCGAVRSRGGVSGPGIRDLGDGKVLSWKMKIIQELMKSWKRMER